MDKLILKWESILSDIQFFLMIKLVYQGKNKIIKSQGKSFKQLRQIISVNFPEVPQDYSLSYLDDDKDEICLNSEEDLVNMLNHNIKLHKVYIKQSLSQTIVLDLEKSDVVEPSFQESRIQSKEEESRCFGKKDVVQEIKVEEQQENNDSFLRNCGQAEEAVKVELSETDMQAESVSEVKEEPKEIVEEVVKIQVDDKQEKMEEPEVFQSENFSIAQEIPRQIVEVSEVIELVVPKKDGEDALLPIRLEVSAENNIFSRVLPSDHIGAPKIEEPPKQDKKVTRAKIFENPYQLKEQLLCEKNEAELPIHQIICTNCDDEFGIVGIRYQCIICNSFNLCSKCEDILEHEHALVKVKKPEMVITKEMIAKKFKDQMRLEHPYLPPGHYVPSINHDEAKKLFETAKVAYDQGMNRSKNLMQELFYKMSMSHKNPSEGMKPAPPKPPKRIDTVYQKTKYLQDTVGLQYNEAFRFASQYPHHTSEQVLEQYFKVKN